MDTTTENREARGRLEQQVSPRGKKRGFAINAGRFRVLLRGRRKWSLGASVERELLMLRLPRLYVTISDTKCEPGWRILPGVHYTNMRRHFPQASPNAFRRWFDVSRYWGGKLVKVSVRHHTLTLDYRADWVQDFLDA